jgi:hypothetical protein
VAAVLTNPYRICRAAFPSDNPEWHSSYSYLSKLDDDVIAFEFLRRSPSYWEFFASVDGGDPYEVAGGNLDPLSKRKGKIGAGQVRDLEALRSTASVAHTFAAMDGGSVIKRPLAKMADVLPTPTLQKPCRDR